MRARSSTSLAGFGEAPSWFAVVPPNPSFQRTPNGAAEFQRWASRMPQSIFKVPVLEKLSVLLRPLGFRKTAAVFARPINDVFHLIEVQGSRHSTAAEAIYTVNAAVFVPSLIYQDVREFTRPSVAASHWQERLGNLAHRREHAWWSARTKEEAENNAREIASLVAEFALPALAQLSDVESVRLLWAGGQSPGLTEKQREEFLERLNRSERNAMTPNPSFQRTAFGSR